jgi:hypothetical protein
LYSSLSSLFRLSSAKTLSISAENPTGEKGKGGMALKGTGLIYAGDLGQGWKVSPSVDIQPGQTFTLAEINGSGAIEHIWMTPTGNWRLSILRMYWDDEKDPSVEAPVGDFFAMGWGKYAQISSLAVCVNPGSTFNSYWPMPFRSKAKITMQNLDSKPMTLYYQIDYTRAKVPNDAAYFHAQFPRANPQLYKQPYTIVDNIRGTGQYVGTYLAWRSPSPGWWGEGEIKFYLDGDEDFPTVNVTGTEDYFDGSYDFIDREKRKFDEFSTPYSGLVQVLSPPEADTPPPGDQAHSAAAAGATSAPAPVVGGGQGSPPRKGLFQPLTKFGMYRWHIADPIRFDKDLKVTIQDLGFERGPAGKPRFAPLTDDIASVAFWYQTEPHAVFPKLPSMDQLEIR